MLFVGNNITIFLSIISIISYLILSYYTYKNKYKLYIISYILLSLNFLFIYLSNFHTKNFINDKTEKDYKIALSLNIFIVLIIISAMTFMFSLNI